MAKVGAADTAGMTAQVATVNDRPGFGSLAAGLGITTPATRGVLRLATCTQTVSYHR